MVHSLNKPLPQVRLQDLQIPREALNCLPRDIALLYNVLPITLKPPRANAPRQLVCATANPSDLDLVNTLQRLTKCWITFTPADEEDIKQALRRHYPSPDDAASEFLASSLPLTSGESSVESPPAQPAPAGQAAQAAQESTDQSGDMYDETRISKIINSIIRQAVQECASDIHIQPDDNEIFVRFRVDGVLYDQFTLPLILLPQLVARIKVIADMDIAQNRKPQDGRFEVSIGERSFDVRISTVPMAAGQKVVMRLLSKNRNMLGYDQLGLVGRPRELVEAMLRRPYGMILASGPTGCGKTTTMYACLSTIDCVGHNVLTIEDPIEYQLPRIGQIQVNNKIDLTYATLLRTVLRQDPDVILVGEIRDAETLNIAIQASLTGHLVLSTIHGNDTASSATRMVDMGSEPFLVSSSVCGIISQRLLRRICEHCKEPYAPAPEVRAMLHLRDDDAVYYRGTGCNHCRGIGAVGRISVFEVMPMSEPIQRAIVRRASPLEIRQLFPELGVPTLIDDGLEKARAGIISLEEIVRAIHVDA